MRLIVKKIKREALDRDTLLRLIQKFGSVPARVVVAQVVVEGVMVAEQTEMESGQSFTADGPIADPEPAPKTPASK